MDSHQILALSSSIHACYLIAWPGSEISVWVSPYFGVHNFNNPYHESITHTYHFVIQRYTTKPNNHENDTSETLFSTQLEDPWLIDDFANWLMRGTNNE